MNTKKLTTLSLLTTLALILSIVESNLPPIAPIPGIKMGLANIVTLVVLVRFSKKEAFTILILRIILAGIFTGQMFSFMYSMAGGICCFLVMSVLIKIFNKNRLWILSVFGALAHNTGQIIMAIIITSTWQTIWYLPILVISAVITGMSTGITAQFLLKHKIG